MQAVWLEDNALSLRQDIPIPAPSSGEALVKVRLAGICATDLEMVRGYYPFTGIPGHEFVGEVVTAWGDTKLSGCRVTGEINITCGQCRACLAGRRTHCEKRTTLGIRGRDGVFAEYLTLPLENLHCVPDAVDDEAAVFTEPLAAALEIQEQVAIHPGERILLIGAGRLGQLIAQTLALTGCELQVVARHDAQRKLLEAFGIATIAEGEVQAGRWDIVVEASGSAPGFALARQAVRPRGVIVLKSTFKGNSEVNLSSLVVDEISLVGSRCGPFPAALRLLGSGRVQPKPLISGRYPLSKALAAFDKASLPGVMKILLEPG